jgi:TrkA-N domain
MCPPGMSQAARVAGFNVTYGDGSRASVIKAFGVQDVRACVVVYTARRRSVAAVENLRAAFPDTPIWARALDLRCRGCCMTLPAAAALHPSIQLQGRQLLAS